MQTRTPEQIMAMRPDHSFMKNGYGVEERVYSNPAHDGASSVSIAWVLSGHWDRSEEPIISCHYNPQDAGSMAEAWEAVAAAFEAFYGKSPADPHTERRSKWYAAFGLNRQSPKAPADENPAEPIADISMTVAEIGAAVEAEAQQEARNHKHGFTESEQVLHAGGKAASTPIPPLHLIPTVALEALANRFQLGIERKGDKSWNALSPNQEILADVQFAIDRCGHVIHHALKLRDKLLRGDTEAMLADSDGSAIAWGGVFLTCVVDAMTKKDKD